MLKTSKFAYLDPEFHRAVRVARLDAPQWQLAAEAGWTGASVLAQIMARPFLLTELTAARLRNLAKIIGYRGRTAVELTEREYRQRLEFIALARAQGRRYALDPEPEAPKKPGRR